MCDSAAAAASFENADGASSSTPNLQISGLHDRVRNRVRTVGGQAPFIDDLGEIENWSGVGDSNAPLCSLQLDLDLALSQ